MSVSRLLIGSVFSAGPGCVESGGATVSFGGVMSSGSEPIAVARPASRTRVFHDGRLDLVATLLEDRHGERKLRQAGIKITGLDAHLDIRRRRALRRRLDHELVRVETPLLREHARQLHAVDERVARCEVVEAQSLLTVRRGIDVDLRVGFDGVEEATRDHRLVPRHPQLLPVVAEDLRDLRLVREPLHQRIELADPRAEKLHHLGLLASQPRIDADCIVAISVAVRRVWLVAPVWLDPSARVRSRSRSMMSWPAYVSRESCGFIPGITGGFAALSRPPSTGIIGPYLPLVMRSILSGGRMSWS